MANSRCAPSEMITWEIYANELKKAHKEIYCAFDNAFAENSSNPIGKAKNLQQVFEELWKIINHESSLNDECAYPRDSLEKIDRYYTKTLDDEILAKKIKHICAQHYIFLGDISDNKREVLTGIVYLCHFIERQFFIASQLSKIPLADFESFVRDYDGELTVILDKQVSLKGQSISSKVNKIDDLKIVADNELIDRHYVKNKRIKSHTLGFSDNEYIQLSEAFSTLPSHDRIMKLCNQYVLEAGTNNADQVSKLNSFKTSLSMVRNESALVIFNIINAYLMIAQTVNDLSEVIHNIILGKRNKDFYFKHSKFLMLCFKDAYNYQTNITNLIEKCKDISPAEKIGVDNGWKAVSDIVCRWVLQIINVRTELKDQYKELLGVSHQFDERLNDLQVEQDALNSQANSLYEKCNDFKAYYEDNKRGIANNFYNLECNIDSSLAKHRNWFFSHWWKMLITGVIVSAITTAAFFMFMTGMAIPVIAAIGVLSFIGGGTVGLGIGLAVDCFLPKSYGSAPNLEDAAKIAEVAAKSKMSFDANFIESSDEEDLGNILSISSDEDVTENISTITTDAQAISEEHAIENKGVAAGSWFSWFGFFGRAAPVEQVLEEKPENLLTK